MQQKREVITGVSFADLIDQRVDRSALSDDVSQSFEMRLDYLRGELADKFFRASCIDAEVELLMSGDDFVRRNSPLGLNGVLSAPPVDDGNSRLGKNGPGSGSHQGGVLGG